MARPALLVGSYVVPAVAIWALAGLALNILPVSTAATAAILAYTAYYGLLEANGRARPAPPGTSWQVPSSWVLDVPRWRRIFVWGTVLGPGFATRNPYAGFALLLLVVAAVGNVTQAVVLAAMLGAAHGTGRSLGLLRDARGIDAANYLDAVLKSMYWRTVDGYGLIMIGGATVFACLQLIR
ncbi:MAG: hypothetical protein ACR2MP_12575 [Streptosporangiaceae bacterium]